MAPCQLSRRVVDDATGRWIEATSCRCGDDQVIAVGGGDRPHVGVVVVAQPDPRSTPDRPRSPSITVVTIPPHKDEAVARPVAEAVCQAIGRTTVVTAGVHEDELDREGVETYLRLARRLAAVLVEALQENHGGPDS